MSIRKRNFETSTRARARGRETEDTEERDIDNQEAGLTVLR